jgi:hypothetical protein
VESEAVLHPTKTEIFILLSVLMHAAFVALFARVSLSFPPPAEKKFSLTITMREGGRGEIVQGKAGWATPKRIEPGFSAEEVFESLDDDIHEWMMYGPPDPPLFASNDAPAPEIDIAEFAAKAYQRPPEELFSHLPAESRIGPTTDFAIGPALPEIFVTD